MLSVLRLSHALYTLSTERILAGSPISQFLKATKDGNAGDGGFGSGFVTEFVSVVDSFSVLLLSLQAKQPARIADKKISFDISMGLLFIVCMGPLLRISKREDTVRTLKTPCVPEIRVVLVLDYVRQNY